MGFDWLSAFAAVAGAIGVLLSVAVLALLSRERGGAEFQRLRLLSEQALAGTHAEAETTRAQFAQARVEMQAALGEMAARMAREGGEARAMMEAKLRELAEASAAHLASIQRGVNEGLHAAVEKQMTTSFARVTEQFAAVQKAMGDVQATAAQIGDIRRLFSNVKTRGGWGETQLRSLLDDLLPEGAYETNVRLKEGSAEAVEFAIRMPVKGDRRPLLAIDAKFPVEDYERMLHAADSGDAAAEAAARKGFETRLRGEAAKIAGKYVVPPATVEFAVLYLPTDGLYVEAARVPGMLEEISRVHRVLVVGPSLCPALLRTIQLGFLTLQLEQNADRIRDLLGATRTEMGKMDKVLGRLSNQAGTFTNTIEEARKRTRVVAKTLRTIEALEPAKADALLQLATEAALEE